MAVYQTGISDLHFALMIMKHLLFDDFHCLYVLNCEDSDLLESFGINICPKLKTKHKVL